MSSKIYGKCTGSENTKYSTWVSVKQNSQDYPNNKSNVTVSFYVKRNDSATASAYNLNESNTVKLSVGSVIRVNKKIAVDTRNSATVLLGKWTGDVAHSADGTLSLPINGSFSLSGTQTLTGGTVSGSFKCTTIPRKSMLAIKENVLIPGETYQALIVSYDDSFSHKLKLQMGSNIKEISLDTTKRSVSYGIPVEWTEQITNSSKGIVNFTFSTYKGAVLVGSSAFTMTLKIPENEEFLPSFSLSVEKSDETVPEDWDMYIKGLSKIRVSINNIVLKRGATQKNASVCVGGVIKNSLSDEFLLTTSGTIEVKATLKDSRGFIVTKSFAIQVEAYSPPSIDVKSIKRCKSDGTADIYGKSLLVNYAVRYSTLNGKNNYTVKGCFKAADQDMFSDLFQINNSPAVAFENMLLITDSYKLVFCISDLLTGNTSQVERFISGSNIPFNIKRGGNGAAFGKFADKENSLQVGWNIECDENLHINGKINGDVYYESVQCDLTENVENQVSDIRWYPGLSLVYVNIRVTVKKALASGQKGYIAKLKSILPNHFTPVESFINGDELLLCKGGIFSDSGDIFVSPQKTVPVGRYIYINGFYTTDYNI